MNSNQVKIRGCILCYGDGIERDNFVNNNTGVGEINHFLYGVKGTGKLKVLEKEIILKARSLIDLREFAGSKLHYHLASDSEWVAFNSLLERKMEVQVLIETPANLYKSNTSETIFVVIKGEANINNKQLTLFKSGRLFKGKEAKVCLGENSLLAVITFQEIH